MLRPLLQRYALARPNARSSHVTPTPQGGGIAVLAATAVTAPLAGLLGAPQLGEAYPIVMAAAFCLAAVGVIESVKAVSDLFAPLSGDVVESNAELSAAPELLNSDPFGKGWMLRITVADPAQVDSLLDNVAYEALTAEG